jgi:hypothetical protein
VREGKAGGACVRDGEAVGENEVGRTRRSLSQEITMGEGVGKRKRRVRESG